jgi:hypothetical protein
MRGAKEMIRDRVVALLRTFGPLPSSAFVEALGMKKQTVINALGVAKKKGDVRCIRGVGRLNLWEAI